ncbi:MFS general substrate transporter [Hortaea werneckii]|uniref:Major facilitator superfamily (MFS) profile domain-containing protein n=1 Tax=Hortaea werneckii EXF-2000 TaxID=1157616 RepID=A0A1Z5TIT4_HORWE|nr:MFS general substrate transporter [Hortaea werneckii]OTA35936.1 hypothetical protein BTJ68_04141 [Hortaea werneckii EXF-2000]KAI6828790.1 MFS general substrate transporter [Hortaea werneckii]KAI6926346.1 MFS general substrate transporter [Hortaea werneckii]KAI6938511.1 MFS general substrate transporter [Hortaea werneckii]
MAIFKRMNLKQGNTARTNASQLTLRQSIYPICLVTILFFLWLWHFQTILGIDRARSAGLQAAYFGAYPLASLGHANWILRHYGFKLVFIWGLCLYGIGSLVAWPCLLYKSFGGFCAAIFIIGNGLGSLETAANPYITICGPPRYSEMRINISQAFNGIGTVVAPVLGSYVFFKNTGTGENALQNVQWVYLAIAIFVFILAVVFYFSPIPEITDADMEFQAQESHANTDDQPFWKQYRLFHAAFAQFCYTGAQVAIAGYFINYVSENRANTGDSLAAQFLAGAQGAFAMGRFIGSGIMKFVRPRWVFLVYLGLCIVFIAPSITQRGNTGLAMLFLTLFFESICFPTIVALGMRGLGKHSKRGSGWIVGGVCGGAVVPPILGAVADIYDNTAPAMSVPLAFFIAAWTYAICVNFVPAYRIPADRLGETKIGVEDAAAGVHDEENMKGDEMFGVSSEKGGIEQVESNTNSEEIRDVR